MTDARAIRCIRELAQRHAHPGVTEAVQQLALAVRDLCNQSDTIRADRAWSNRGATDAVKGNRP